VALWLCAAPLFQAAKMETSKHLNVLIFYSDQNWVKQCFGGRAVETFGLDYSDCSTFRRSGKHGTSTVFFDPGSPI
jgi:hypothetical protein